MREPSGKICRVAAASGSDGTTDAVASGSGVDSSKAGATRFAIGSGSAAGVGLGIGSDTGRETGSTIEAAPSMDCGSDVSEGVGTEDAASNTGTDAVSGGARGSGGGVGSDGGAGGAGISSSKAASRAW